MPVFLSRRESQAMDGEVSGQWGSSRLGRAVSDHFLWHSPQKHRVSRFCSMGGENREAGPAPSNSAIFKELPRPQVTLCTAPESWVQGYVCIVGVGLWGTLCHYPQDKLPLATLVTG